MTIPVSPLPGTFIMNLPVAISLDGSEWSPLVQGGTTKRAQTGMIAGLANIGTGGLGAFVTAIDQSAIFPNSRRLAGTTNQIILTDNGAASTLVISIDPDFPADLYPPTFLTSANSPYAVLDTDTYLICNSSGGAITLNLQALAARTRPLYVCGTTAATNAVTAVPNGAETVAGLTSLPINSNYQSFWLYPFSATAWLL